jgi:hypothetical protein
VADRERSPERHGPADAADDRIDGADRNADLHRSRHRAVDRDGVAVTAPGDERTHDGITRILHARAIALAPRQPAAADELQLTHPVILAGQHAGCAHVVAARIRAPLSRSTRGSVDAGSKPTR